MFFNAGMYKEVYKELSDLQEFVELNYNEVCWGYPCSYILSHRLSSSLIPAANKDILKEILEIFQPLLSKIDESQERIVSQYLWQLMEGWDIGSVLELFWHRIGLEPTVSYKRADIDHRVKQAKKISSSNL